MSRLFLFTKQDIATLKFFEVIFDSYRIGAS
jgi:hypothetical protein